MTPIEDLKQISQAYRADMPNLLTSTSSEHVENAMQLREEFKVQIREARNVLQTKRDEIEHHLRELAAESAWQTTDVKKLTALFWELKNAEKDATRYTSAR